jgi:hypothetical protein
VETATFDPMANEHWPKPLLGINHVVKLDSSLLQVVQFCRLPASLDPNDVAAMSGKHSPDFSKHLHFRE